MTSIWLPALLIIAAVIGVVIWRGLAFRQLAERGVPVTGTVVKRISTSSTSGGGGMQSNKRLAFTYTGPDGITYRRSASVSLDKWEQYPEGSEIAIICLPDKPGTSGPAWLVELAREALEKKKRQSGEG